MKHRCCPEWTTPKTDIADLWSTAITTTSHPMQRIRDQLRADGILAAAQLRTATNGHRVRVAGVVTHRQRPLDWVGPFDRCTRSPCPAPAFPMIMVGGTTRQ